MEQGVKQKVALYYKRNRMEERCEIKRRET